MNKFLKFVLATVLAVSAFAAMAQGGAQGGKFDMSAMVAAQIDKADKEAGLKLQAPQRKKLVAAMTAFAEKAMKTFTSMQASGQRPDPAKAKALGLQMKSEQESIMKNNLSADQLKKFKSWEAAQMAKMKAGAGKGH